MPCSSPLPPLELTVLHSSDAPTPPAHSPDIPSLAATRTRLGAGPGADFFAEGWIRLFLPAWELLCDNLTDSGRTISQSCALWLLGGVLSCTEALCLNHLKIQDPECILSITTSYQAVPKSLGLSHSYDQLDHSNWKLSASHIAISLKTSPPISFSYGNSAKCLVLHAW